MSKKNDNISVNMLEKYCDGNKKEDMRCTATAADGTEIEFCVKYRLSLEETISFVEDVVNEIVMKSDMMIIPVVRDFCIARYMMEYYAGFTMPKNVNKAYEMVMCSSDIIDVIRDNIDMMQYGMLTDAIDERIDFEKSKMIAEQSYNVNRVLSEATTLTDKVSSVFGGIDQGQMAEFVSGMVKIANSTEVTPKDLAEALVNSAAQ